MSFLSELVLVPVYCVLLVWTVLGDYFIAIRFDNIDVSSLKMANAPKICSNKPMVKYIIRGLSVKYPAISNISRTDRVALI
jgi:hypothetical protein